MIDTLGYIKPVKGMRNSLLNKTPIILASASPRRSELLKQIGMSFEVITSGVDENIDITLPPNEYVKILAEAKSQDVANTLSEGLVIGADTVVVLDYKIVGKPLDENHAFKMLSELQGKSHFVFTGVSIIDVKTNKIVSFVSSTKVTIYELSTEKILMYLNTGEYKDKAGSYGVQGIGASLIKEINGDYFTVVGLPLGELVRVLEEEFDYIVGD